MTEETQGQAPPAPAEGQAAAEPTPVVEQPEQKAEPEAPKDPPQPEAKATEGEEGEEETKRPSGSQRLKRRLRMIEAEFAETQARHQEELRRLQAGAKEGRPGIDREPTEADFPNDYLAYERSKTEYAVRQSVRDEINRERTAAQDRVARELRQERLEAHHENLEEARGRIPDFDKVLATNGKDINLRNEVIEELIQSDKSAVLLYYLAQNPDKARDLNGLSGRELAREIGRLEGRVHLPKPKTQTKADPPLSTPKGGAAPPVNIYDPNMDMETYVRERQKQMGRKSA